MNKRPLQELGGGMAQSGCECLENRQIGGAFEVENPTSLLCLVIALKSDFFKRLEDLAAPVIYPVRFTDKGYDSGKRLEVGGAAIGFGSIG